MALPKFEAPVYSLQLPSTGETVKYRPFLVKEQKSLLLATNSDVTQQIDAINEIIAACTFNKVDAAKLASFDAEYLFLQIRAKSVGEKVQMTLTCGHCEHKSDAMLDVTQVGVKTTAGHSNSIEFGGNRILKMRYPRLEEVEELAANRTVDGIIRLIARSIDSIWDADEMYAATDYSTAELIEFVEALSPADLDALEKFFETSPVLAHDIEWDCANCKEHNKIRVEGIQSFFA
jgi:hypothetical protein